MAKLAATIEVMSSRFTIDRRIRIVVDSITGIADDGPERGVIYTYGGQSYAVKESYDQILAKIGEA